MSALGEVLYNVVLCPVMTCWLLTCVLTYVYMIHGQIDMKAVAVGYSDVVLKGQYWRPFTAAMCHTTFTHMLLSVFSLWSCRRLEIEFGSGYVFRNSIILIVVETALSLGFLHFILKGGAREWGLSIAPPSQAAVHYLMHLTSVGSTGALLAWITFQSVHSVTPQPPSSVSSTSSAYLSSRFYVMGIFPVAWQIAPLVFVLAVQLLAPRVNSFTIAFGLLSGYLLVSGLVNVMPTLYWTLCYSVNLFLVVASSLANSDADRESVGQRGGSREIGMEMEVGSDGESLHTVPIIGRGLEHDDGRDVLPFDRMGGDDRIDDEESQSLLGFDRNRDRDRDRDRDGFH